MILGYRVWLRDGHRPIDIDATQVVVDARAGRITFLKPLRPTSHPAAFDIANLAGFAADEERHNFKLRFMNANGALIVVPTLLEKGNAPRVEEKFVVIKPPGDPMPRAMIARDLIVGKLTDLF
ncbi:MAG: hypothetical protein WCA77_08850 [Thermoplasmata archaeon]